MDTGSASQLAVHQQMWHNFVRLLGFSAGAIAVLLLLMAAFLL